MARDKFEQLKAIYSDADAPAKLLDSSLNELWSNETAQRECPGFFRVSALPDGMVDALKGQLARYGSATYRAVTFPALQGSVSLVRHGDFVAAVGDRSPSPLATGSVTDMGGLDVFTNMMRSAIDTITLSTQSIERTVDTDDIEVTRLFEGIRRSSYRMLRNVQNATLMARYLSGTLTLNRKNCNVTELARTVCIATQSVCRRPVDIHFTATDEALITAVDIKLCERALLNILLNAIESSHDNNRIDVTMALSAESIVLTVRDHGTGILRDNLPYVTEPYFSQVPNDVGSQPSGLGLGLAIAAAFCQMHGGALFVDSQPGEGTSVASYIKRQPIEDNVCFHTSIAEYVADRFSPIYIELCDVCEIPF